MMVSHPVHVPAWQGAYSLGATEGVYSELVRRADAVLRSGRPVVLDASFARRRYRAEARKLAERHGVPFRFVECRATPAALEERLRQRAEQPGVSDGRLEILADFAARWQPVEELAEGEVQIVDTTQPIELNLEAIEQQLAIGRWDWPSEFTGIVGKGPTPRRGVGLPVGDSRTAP
ncbi:MAG: AAA family ATPase [Acidobacteriota bacterium]